MTQSYLERLEKALKEKLVNYRLELIDSLEQNYPYRTRHLTPAEQVLKFDNMDGKSWAILIQRLYERYRGLPDATRRVNNDLAAYVRAMMQTKQNVDTSTIDPAYHAAFAPPWKQVNNAPQ